MIFQFNISIIETNKPTALQVMHGDLKTRNVLLTKNFDAAKISDVGLAQILDHRSITSPSKATACARLSQAWPPHGAGQAIQ